MECYSRLSPLAKLRMAKVFAAVSIVLAVLCSTMLFLVLEDIPLSKLSGASSQLESNTVEMIMVDSPALSHREISIIAQTMTAVLTNGQSEYSPHLRIVAYGAGALINVQLDNGLAAYLGDRDVFVIDVRKAKSTIQRILWRAAHSSWGMKLCIWFNSCNSEPVLPAEVMHI